MGILSWIFFGLIIGMLAKQFFIPDKSIIVTTLLGIIGAVLGGGISILLKFGSVDYFTFGSILLAIIGAIIILWIYRKVKN
ncbi:MAG: GlsB/YeaQ/YmgE family stress response membrane protein [Candidatus Dasytiphilus stammeri]